MGVILDKRRLTVVSQFVFVEDAALGLPGDVENQDAPNLETVLLRFGVKVFPESLVEFLRDF
jgi:hypothetical protein